MRADWVKKPSELLSVVESESKLDGSTTTINNKLGSIFKETSPTIIYTIHSSLSFSSERKRKGSKEDQSTRKTCN